MMYLYSIPDNIMKFSPPCLCGLFNYKLAFPLESSKHFGIHCSVLFHIISVSIVILQDKKQNLINYFAVKEVNTLLKSSYNVLNQHIN